jgi:ankyrin repeat protein
MVVAAVPALAQYSEGYNFLKAVRERDGGKVQSIIANPGSTALNHRDSRNGEGALHMLVRARELSWLSYLLSRGARPDLQDNDGNTPLVLAAQIGWVEGADQLLDRRANVNLPNSRGESPLIMAVQRRDVAMVRLLLSKGADPNHTDSVSGYSALEYAQRDSRAQAILRMIEQQARRPSAGPTR